jgi:hypothetical protein
MGNRSLSGLFREGLKRLQNERRTLGRLADEYTPAQRLAIDADIAASRPVGLFDEGCACASRPYCLYPASICGSVLAISINPCCGTASIGNPLSQIDI